MNEIRSILLHLDATAGSVARLAFAHAFADRHDARVTALFGVRPDARQESFGYSAAAALHDAEERVLAIDGERARLRELLADGERGCVWCDVVGDSVLHGFLAEAAYADLLVLGEATAGAEGGAPAGFVESVILQSGTPAIVVPHPHRQATIGERALVAWNGSVQAARALKAALPILQRSASVDVVSWARQAPTAPFSGLDLERWLERHGIRARMHLRAPAGDIAVELRDAALQLGCDVLVMGCYGHSRIREQVFGGVTRALLARLPVPLLMAH
jgi:nucleotide-binding universal stress UspA family protein